MGEASYTADGGKRRCSSNAEMFLTEFRRATRSSLGSSPLNGAQQAYALLATKQKRDRGREGEKQMRESRKLMPKKTWSVMYTMSRKMYQFCVLARQLTRFARCLLYSKAWVQIRPNEMKSHSPFPKSHLTPLRRTNSQSKSILPALSLLGTRLRSNLLRSILTPSM
jgi:hypothetical protein